MRLVNRNEMEVIDRRSIEEFNIASWSLMQAAGLAVARAVQRYCEKQAKAKSLKIVAVCGAGKNGGDGLVAAAALKRKGFKVEVALLAEPNDLQGDSKRAFEAWKKNKGASTVIASTAFKADVIIDAIFGTGFSPRPHSGQSALPLSLQAIVRINECKREGAYVIAVDLPSGLDATTGQSTGTEALVVHANLTVTLGLPKLGMVGDPGVFSTGRLEVASLPFEPTLLHVENPPSVLIDPDEFGAHLRPRDVRAQKGDFGHVVIIGGSHRMPGALVMAVEAALRSGAGKVTGVVPGLDLVTALAARIPEAMWFPVESDVHGYLSSKDWPKVFEFLERLRGEQTVVVYGPGIGQTAGTGEWLRLLLETWSKTSLFSLVLDADALNLLSQANIASLLPVREADHLMPLVLTPHPGEAGRLLNQSAAEVQGSRFEAAQNLAKRFGAWVVLKGFRTLLANALGSMDVCSTGNPGMARGGMGDVLSGVLGARLAVVGEKSQRFAGCWRQALQAGIYVHGLAGDFAAHDVGMEGMIARDVIGEIPLAFRAVQDGDADR